MFEIKKYNDLLYMRNYHMVYPSNYKVVINMNILIYHYSKFIKEEVN